jgi:hypothetical protein
MLPQHHPGPLFFGGFVSSELGLVRSIEILCRADRILEEWAMIVFILLAVIGLVLLVISVFFGLFGDDIEIAPEVEGAGLIF